MTIVTTTAYEDAGVRGHGDGLASIRRHLGATFGAVGGVEVLTDFGHYASVLKVADDLAVAVSTDGVGSKTLLAAALGRFDTIGFDCVAMNVNDILCVGARPIALVDYLGVHDLDDVRMEGILEGLGAAAKNAGIAIPGGEIAQLPEVIGPDGDAFDLVGTCIGIVHPDRLVLGRDIVEGDAVIGIRSSGIHSNGLTLARHMLLGRAGLSLEEPAGPVSVPLGQELLRPTEIYVRAITSLWSAGLATPGLAHITSDGLANLCRLEAPTGFSIEHLPETPPIFQLIQQTGAVDDAEMFRVFNMGIGFVVVVRDDDTDDAVEVIRGCGYGADRIGTATGDPGVTTIGPPNLVARRLSGELTISAGG
ncbi:MAG: phosphoribosylformylglycinamidine cyclo-ligase [Actinobacteria bacterium]|nr:phosphoribosylformylglycinamidine cyclo-ligase [Actinomycetota bacterium]